jgi:citrate lyase subunit gamma (acyl carrier protein)
MEMDIISAAMAGTLESSDAQVTIEPFEDGISFEMSSSVINQYGRQIRQVVTGTLKDLGVVNAKITVVDRGALDSTIKARVECAAFRASGWEGAIPWRGLVR